MLDDASGACDHTCMTKLKFETTRKGIQKAVAQMPLESTITFKLRPIEHHSWCWNDENVSYIGDGVSHPLSPSVLRHVVERNTMTGIVDQREIRTRYVNNREVCGEVIRVMLENGEDDDSTVWLFADQIESIHVDAPPLSCKIDGLPHLLKFQRDGSLKIGCQTITPAGVEQAFRALAQHLGYELTE